MANKISNVCKVLCLATPQQHNIPARYLLLLSTIITWFIFIKKSLPSYMHCVCDLLQYLVLDIGYMPENWVLGLGISFEK